MSVGIDAISFYSSQYFIDMRTLAEARGVSADKYCNGLGQQQMGVVPPDEDVITMAASAAYPLLANGSGPQRYRHDEFDMVMFTTESGVDQSKAGAIYVRHLLGLSPECRVIELKQACYSSTAGLQLALAYVATNPTRKILVIASDVARYGLNTPGEPTQGCGAVAIVVSAQPRLFEIDAPSGCYTEDVMDFWRPNYMREALVDGKYSAKLYLTALDETWRRYTARSGFQFGDHARFCYHIPFSRMAEKAHKRLSEIANAPAGSEGARSLARGSCVNGGESLENGLLRQIAPALTYNRLTGNSYSASLYIGLASLLDNEESDLSGERIALFSYGSGCSAEFFSGIVQQGYREQLLTKEHRAHISGRSEVNYRQYEEFFQFDLPRDGRHFVTPTHRTGPFRLAGVSQHRRMYAQL